MYQASTPLIAVLMLRELGFSPAQYGLALGVPCVAGVLGSLLAPAVIRRFGLPRTLWFAGAARCLWAGLLPLAGPSPAGLALIIASDSLLLTCAGVFNPAFATYRMRATEDRYLARVAGAWAVTGKVVQPVVIAAAGLAAAAFGVRTSLTLLAGVLLVSIVLLPWRAPLTEPPADDPPAPTSVQKAVTMTDPLQQAGCASPTAGPLCRTSPERSDISLRGSTDNDLVAADEAPPRASTPDRPRQPAHDRRRNGRRRP